MNWHPSATLQRLREAAKLRHAIRTWMEQQQILEVLTPALSRAAATDPQVLSLQTMTGHYLHTSPEFPMKRLLAAHANALSDGDSPPDLYQIATVFRAEQSGRFHNTEFTLLEWYRHGMDHVQLMADLTALLQYIWQEFGKAWPGLQLRRYGEEVRQRTGLWPEALTVRIIAEYFAAQARSYPDSIGEDLDAALDLFMDEFVLPEFDQQGFTLLIEYPVSQAALARLGSDIHGRRIAQRFELYHGKVELANGFHELTDAELQRERFRIDLERRLAMGVDAVPMDEYLLQALAAGCPACAGIALGLERLHMVLGEHDHIRQVRSFDDARA